MSSIVISIGGSIQLSVSSELRRQIDSQRSKLAAIQTTDSQARKAVAESFVAGYRSVVWIAVALLRCQFSQRSASDQRQKENLTKLGAPAHLESKLRRHLMKITDLLLAELEREAVGIRKTLERVPERKE